MGNFFIVKIQFTKIPPPDREGIFLKLYYFWIETRILWRVELYEYISNLLIL